MSKDNAIIPTEQREIKFYEDTVTAVIKDGTVFVPLRPICELIGLNWQGQLERIKRDPILNEFTQGVRVTRTPASGGEQTMICLPLDYLNGWLFGINANRVKDESRDAVLRYQRECYKVLFDAFSTGVAVRPDNELMQSSDPAAIAFRNALANAKLARETYYLTQRVNEHEKRIDETVKRLGLIEAQLSNPDAYITQEQAQLISAAVKAIGTMLGKVSGRNEFGAVYSELYQRYGVTSYKNIASQQYETVMNWLRDWWQQLTDRSDAPF